MQYFWEWKSDATRIYFQRCYKEVCNGVKKFGADIAQLWINTLHSLHILVAGGEGLQPQSLDVPLEEGFKLLFSIFTKYSIFSIKV